jgi:outer membrane protein assembly factor BamB
VIDGGTNDGPGYSATIRALDIDDGSVLWGPVPIPDSTYGTVELAYGGGRLFAMNQRAQLRALDAATGDIVWTMTPPGQTSAGRALTHAGGAVYGTTYGNGQTNVFAASADDGSILWTSLGGSVDSAPIVHGDRVYVAGPGGMTYAFDRSSGARAWVRDTGMSGGGGGTMALHDGRLYATAGLNAAILDAATGAVLAPFTSTSSSLPTFWGDDRIQRVPYDRASNFGPVAATHEPTGVVRWTEDGDDPTFRAGYKGNPVVIGGDVFVATRYGVVDRYRISDGARTWRATIPKADTEDEPGAVNSLTIGNGLLLVQTQGQITAYG